MNKFIKINFLFFIILSLSSCGTIGEALQGKKRSDQGDEFLIDKKNPLAMPPDYYELPKPGEANLKSITENDYKENNIKNLLKNNDKNNTSISDQSTSIEKSLIKKIK